MTPAPESPDAARDHDPLAGAMVVALVNQCEPEFLPDDIRDRARELVDSGEYERMSDEEGERRVLAVLRALIAPQSPDAGTITRLTAERDAALRDAERWRALYRRAVNEANGLTNYVEDRPELRSAERKLAAIEAEARALSAQERGNV